MEAQGVGVVRRGPVIHELGYYMGTLRCQCVGPVLQELCCWATTRVLMVLMCRTGASAYPALALGAGPP